MLIGIVFRLVVVSRLGQTRRVRELPRTGHGGAISARPGPGRGRDADCIDGVVLAGVGELARAGHVLRDLLGRMGTAEGRIFVVVER